jgi:predicted phage tail protein
MKNSEIELVNGGWSAVVTGAGKGGGRKPVEDPESLRSRSEAIFVTALSEGEVQGFESGVDPFTRIFLDGVPIKNKDGSYNYTISAFYTGSSVLAEGKGSLISNVTASLGSSLTRQDATGKVNSVVLDYRVGTQNQDPMPGFDDVRAEQGVNIKLSSVAGSVSRVTASNLFNRLRIRVGVGSLFRIDKETGDCKGTSVSFSIQIRPENSSNYIKEETRTISGKSRGSVDFEYEYKLSGNGPWVVTLTRLTADPATTATSDDLYFKAIVGIVDQSFRYPNTALFGLKIGAENFSSVPQVSMDMCGMKIKIPSNYDPIARSYSGIWNGVFKTEYSNNPAWVFYDLLTNSRYGCGQFISENQVDRYSLYSIAQYCDEKVSDGKGGTEPRLTFNAYITDRGEAYDVLNSLAASFRGMLYFAEGAVVAIQDKPKNISKIFSPSNVIQEVDDNGNVTTPPFQYEGTARRARKTVALVSWNDPDDSYKGKIEYVEDAPGIDRYGYHETEIRAFGTTSQGQAQRIGRWTLLTNQLETETITFKTGTEGFFVLPGEVIGIADPAKGGKRYGGRIVDASVSTVTLDQTFTIVEDKSYSLSTFRGTSPIVNVTRISDNIWQINSGQLPNASISILNSTNYLAGESVKIACDGITGASVVSINDDFTQITTDRSLPLATTSIKLIDGILETRVVTNVAGDYSTITVSPAFSIAPESGAPWIVQENAEGIRTFRVISITENDGKVTVLGSLYDETKFIATDEATNLNKPRISLATTQIVPRVVNGSIILGVPQEGEPV